MPSTDTWYAIATSLVRPVEIVARQLNATPAKRGVKSRIRGRIATLEYSNNPVVNRRDRRSRLISRDRYIRWCLDAVHSLIHNLGGKGKMMEVNKDLYRRELLKGSTDTLLLSLLTKESMYGYQLVKEMDKRSSGYFRLKEGTLYPALHRLERDGLIDGYWQMSPGGQKRRYYQMTAKGLTRLESMLNEWSLFTKAVDLVARPDIA